MAALIICIESTDKYCSAALYEDTQLCSFINDNEPQSHAEKLALMLATLRAEAGRNPDAIAISRGPGSYTGLRIGASLAKGLCFGWDIPLISIDTLQALAWSMRHETGLWEGAVFIPMTDARRMEVYTAVYEASDLNCVLPVLPKVLEPGDFRYYAQESKVVFAGSGAAKWRNHCEWAEQALFLEHLFPRAEGMGSLALDAYKKRQFEDVAYFEPFYLKQFQPGKGSVT